MTILIFLFSVLTSVQAKNLEWVTRSSGVKFCLRGIEYTDSSFITVGDGKLVSSDGIQWTQINHDAMMHLNAIEYENNQIIAVGSVIRWCDDFNGGTANFGAIHNSSDGLLWSNTIFDTICGMKFKDVKYGNFGFVLVADNYIPMISSGTIWNSTDGFVWRECNIDWLISALNGVAYGSGLYVVVGDNYGIGISARSSDGITWVAKNITDESGVHSPPYSPKSVTYGKNLFVAVGYKKFPYKRSAIITSQDGITWIERDTSRTNRLNKVIYADSQFVAVGDSGAIMTSENGILWNSSNSNIVNNLYDVSCGNNQFIIVGDSGTILSSLYDSKVEDARVTKEICSSVLCSVYPNPFNPTTTIEYNIPNGLKGKLMICSVDGKVVKDVDVSGKGAYLWKADSRVASGMYVCRLGWGKGIIARKMVLCR